MGIIEGVGLGTPFQTAGAPTNGTTEVQTLTLSAVPASGAFTVKYDGYTTTSLAFDVSAANMQVALRLLPSIGSAGCTVGLIGQVYTVTFAGNLAKLALPLMTIPTNTVKDAGAADVTITPAEGTPGVTATGRGSPVGSVCIDTTNGAFYINTGSGVNPTWVATDLAGVTASAAELNLIDSSVAGTAVASKAAVLGANKELDEVHAVALYLGAAAGTLVGSTAVELNQLDASANEAGGLDVKRIAKFRFDPSLTAGMRTVAAHGLGVTIPASAVVVGGFVDVNTAFTSAAGTAEIAISVEGANDIISAAAVSGAPYSTIGLKAIVPKANTPESTGIKLTAAREVTATVSVQALLTGKLTGFLEYVISAVSA